MTSSWTIKQNETDLTDFRREKPSHDYLKISNFALINLIRVICVLFDWRSSKNDRIRWRRIVAESNRDQSPNDAEPYSLSSLLILIFLLPESGCGISDNSRRKAYKETREHAFG